jgi:hypothetical protein
LTACQGGYEDPRKHFPMISDALSAFQAITAEEHKTPVNSPNYGTWIPEERWAEQLGERPMRVLDPASDFLFLPYMKEWTVRGYDCGGRVPIFEDFSVPFNFSAPFIGPFQGARVRVYFDPTEARCQGTVVLVNAFGTHKAGEILGVAPQTNEVAGYARMVMGWGEDPSDLGRKVRQQNAAAMRREVRTIEGGGKNGHGSTEVRDGLLNKAVIEISSGSVMAAESASRECASRAGSNPTDGGLSTPCDDNRGRKNTAPVPASDGLTTSEALERRRKAEEFEAAHAMDFI